MKRLPSAYWKKGASGKRVIYLGGRLKEESPRPTGRVQGPRVGYKKPSRLYPLLKFRKWRCSTRLQITDAGPLGVHRIVA